VELTVTWEETRIVRYRRKITVTEDQLIHAYGDGQFVESDYADYIADDADELYGTVSEQIGEPERENNIIEVRNPATGNTVLF